jgi:LuxR family maltose regulon positive regulatory protein
MTRLLRSKLRAATLPRFAVARTRLTRRVAEGTGGRLTLISAPAGFGKSVLVSQWAATRAAEPAWLSIDARDRDAARLAQHLVASLIPHGFAIDDDFVTSIPPENDALGDTLVDQLVESMHDLGETCFVLEDIDRVGESPIADDLARLIREAPPTLHFVVTSRADLNLPLHRLRTHGELTQLRADDLRFTTGEARALMDELADGRALTDDQLSHLVARTEGWPVALQLAALSLQSIDDVDLFIDRFAEDDRSIADFLSSEFLNHEADDTRRFLIDVSVLENLHPELCNVVVDGVDSNEMLQTLERRGLFITRLPRRATWYRCHRLVREFLRHDLRSTQPDRPRVLLTRAASWYAARGDLVQAANCLVEGEGWTELEALMVEHGAELLDNGDAASVLGWIDAIPVTVRQRSVPLQLTQAALSMVVGRLSAASATIHSLEENVTLEPGPQLAADVILASLIEAAQPPEVVLERTERVLDADPTGWDASIVDIFGLSGVPSMHCYMCTTAARAHLLLGDAPAAEAMIARAESLLDGTTPRFQVHALGTRGLIDALSGRLIGAESAARRAIELGHQHLAAHHPALITPFLALALVARARNQLAEAEQLAGATCDDAERFRRWPWVGLLRAEQAQLLSDHGRPERAIEVVRAFAQTSAPPPSPLVASRLGAAEARALLMLGDRECAQHLVEDDAAIRAHPATASIRVMLACANGDPARARKEVDNWPFGSAPIGADEYEMWSAVVRALDGDQRGALNLLAALVSRAEREGHIRIFLDSGPDGVRLVRELHRTQPRPYTRRILDAAAARPMPKTAAALVEQLSGRELAVLRYLPTRMSYSDIARVMFVSVNTLKTHVRHISQKLGVSGRDAAVARAEELGLL